MQTHEAKPQAQQGPPEKSEDKPRRESEAPGTVMAAPGRMTLPATVLQLQRHVGNRQVQRMLALARETPASEGEISPEVERSISRSRGNGRPLDAEVRGRMEASFGTDFGGVRVHTGGEADRLNRQLSARAFTTGSDVFFRSGEYRPGSSAGRELLAHELTHVVQQQGTVQTSRLTLGPPGDRFEQEAESAARQVMRDEEVSVAPGAGGVARSVQRQDAGPAQEPKPLTVDAGTFDQVAEMFSIGLRDKYPLLARAGVIIINGANIGVYDGFGQPVAGRSFTLKRPSGLGRGVYVQFAGSNLGLHKVLRLPDGTWDQSPGQMSGDIDFRRDVEPRQAFDNAFKEFKEAAFYIVPGVREDLVPEEDLPERPIEEKPEFMKVNTHRKAELDAWPGAVVPLTPQVTAVGSTGQFYCRLDKVQGFSLVDDVTNAAERVNFRWEVLKLDPKLLVEETDDATRWESTQTRFKTKARHIEDDEKTLLGDARASVPEKMYRHYLKQQMAVPRRILGYGGEAVLSILHSLLDNHDRNIEDYISHMFEAPGNYFVRCLATPVGGSRQRATTVAGVMVSVFDIKEVAAESLDTAAELKERALTGLEQIEPELERLRAELAAETRAERRVELQVQIRMTELRRPFFEAVQRASGDAYAVRVAELEYVRARLAYLTGKEAPVFQGTQNQLGLRKQIEGLKAEEKRLEGQVKRVDSKLGEGVTRTGFMRANLVDDTSGGSQEVLLTIGERQYVSTDRLEVVIGDVTSEKGRRFTGMGSGFLGRGRSDAWHEAIRDLQRNLGKGRGWLSYEAPEPYASLNEGLDNPLQLQVAELDQMKELLDDAAHAATLVALLAAPFTGGASLGILAVLAPLQIGSSLYNIVNRAMYDDLELDVDSIGSFVDIATLGLGKLTTAGKLATRGVRIVATSSRIAVQLLDKGMYVVFTYSTYMELMKDYPGETPTEARVRRLKTLLDYFTNASIPVAHHIWPPGTAPHRKAAPHEGTAPHDGPDAHPAPHDEPAPKEHEKPAAKPAAAEPAPHPAARAEAAPAPAMPAIPKEYEKALAGAPRKVPPVLNPDLPKDTVRIRYEVVDGVITRMWMEIAPGTKASLVKQHVTTAKDMARYMGLSGQVRRVYRQIVDWLKLNPVAGPESRAWEAEREVRKLQRIIDEQFAAYDKAVLDDNVALRDELHRELDNLEAQLHEHARDVDQFDAKGRGVVAAEGRGDRPTFSAETSRRDAFRKLGGFETRPGRTGLEPASDLRRFADALVREKIVDSPEALARQMPDPKGLSHEAVLDALKAPNLAKLVDRASDAKRLRSLASYREARQAGAVPARALHEAAAAEAKRIADLLPEADRAAFLDAWKAKNPEPAAPAMPAPKVEPIGAEALHEDLRPEPARAPEAAAEPSRAAQEWLDRLRSELPEPAQKRLDGMARGKTPAETRALIERLGGKDYLVRGAREAEARAAANAASPGRAREIKETLGADAGFLEHPEVKTAIRAGDAAKLRSEMAAEMAGRAAVAAQAAKGVQGARALRGVRVVREQPYASVAEARKALNAQSMADTGKPYAGVIYERDGKVYTVSTDIDVLVIQDVPGQPSKVLRLEEVKSGEKDTPGEAASQVDKAGKRLAEIAAGDQKVRLELADGTDITGTIDAASAAGAEKATRGPLDSRSKPFDEHLDVTSRDLLKAAEEMMGEQRRKAPQGGETAPATPAPAAAPTPATPPPAPASTPAHKTLDQLIVNGRFTDAPLQKAYDEYVARQKKVGDPEATPEEWVNLTRGEARERLKQVLGPHHSFGGTGTGVERRLPLTDFAQPASYTQARLDADLAAVEKDAGKLWERLGRLQNEGVTGGVVGESLFNILKGNAAEILSRPIQAAEVAKVQQQHPGARLYDDVRARIYGKDGKLTDWVLFTDNVVATKRGQALDLHAVFEVKAGSKGGQEATSQVFDWIEGKLDEKIQIQVGGDTYVYDPGSNAPNQVIGLARADRHLIAAQGAEHLGLDSGDQIARKSTRHALPQTADEINFLTRALIEKHIAQKEGPVPAPAPTPAPAPAPAALPEPAGRPGTRDVGSPLEAAQEEYLSSPHELHSPEDAHWVLAATRLSLEGAAMISEWIPTTNAVGAEVFKSLTRITAEPPHVEGFVVYGQRKGKKVTIITGYHGSSQGLTVPEKKFAVDDAKYYNEKHPDVDVIDTSEMTHDQRLALIEAIPGVVIVSTCFAASAAPSAAAPGQPRGGHAESIFLPNPEMLKRLIGGVNTRPQASYSVTMERHRLPSPEQMREMFRDPAPEPAPARTPKRAPAAPTPAGASRGQQYGLITTVHGVNVRRAMSDLELERAGGDHLGAVRPGLEGFLEEGIYAVKASATTLGSIILLEAEKVLGNKGDLWFSPSRELADRFAHDFDELIRHVQSVVDSYGAR